jgi:hypothetical protein
MLLDRLLGLAVLCCVLLALELLHGLDQDLRIGDQIVADRLAECRLVAREHRRCRRAVGQGADAQDGADGDQPAAQDEKNGAHGGYLFFGRELM